MKRIFEAHISVDVLLSDQVMVETQASNTAENAKRTLELLQKERGGLLATLETLLLVSCDYHMHRARHEFATRFPGVRILCCPFVNAPDYRHVKAIRELSRLRRLGVIPIQRAS